MKASGRADEPGQGRVRVVSCAGLGGVRTRDDIDLERLPEACGTQRPGRQSEDSGGRKGDS